MSRVDVVVPCYKYGHFLSECVQSVLTQPVDVRVLIIDDASPDNTADVALALQKRDSRVSFIRHPVNRGHIATYNEGLLSWASGEYLLLLSADDLVTPGALSRAASFMDANPQVGFIYGKAITAEVPEPSDCVVPDEFESRVLTGVKFVELTCKEAANLVITPTAVVRTSLQQKVGGYREDLPHTGDLEMWNRLAVHASVGVLNCDQAIYRVHGNNMHRKTYTGASTVIRQHEKAFEILFEEFGDRIPDRERLRRLAMRGVALGALGRATRILEQGDPAACDEILEIALQVYPELRSQGEWSRLRLKRVLGPNVIKLLRSLVHPFRRPPVLDRHPFGRSGVFPGL